MVVEDALRSDGIKNDEGRMIRAVLDMQDTEVSDALYQSPICEDHLSHLSHH
jgi:hypothetical protein